MTAIAPGRKKAPVATEEQNFQEIGSAGTHQPASKTGSFTPGRNCELHRDHVNHAVRQRLRQLLGSVL